MNLTKKMIRVSVWKLVDGMGVNAFEMKSCIVFTQ